MALKNCGFGQLLALLAPVNSASGLSLNIWIQPQTSRQVVTIEQIYSLSWEVGIIPNIRKISPVLTQRHSEHRNAAPCFLTRGDTIQLVLPFRSL